MSFPALPCGLDRMDGIDNMFFQIAYMIRTDVWVVKGRIATKGTEFT